MDVLTGIIRKQQFRKRLQQYFKDVNVLCERELTEMFSRLINKVNGGYAGELSVTLLALTKVFFSKCSNLKDSLRSKIRREISKTSNLVARVLIERELAESLNEITDLIQSMCIEISACWTYGLNRICEDCRDFEEVKIMFDLIEEVPKRSKSVIISGHMKSEKANDIMIEHLQDPFSILRTESKGDRDDDGSLDSEASDLASEMEPEHFKVFDQFEDSDDFWLHEVFESSRSEAEESQKDDKHEDAASIRRAQPQTKNSQRIHAEARTALRELKGLLNLLTYKPTTTRCRFNIDNLSEDGQTIHYANGNSNSVLGSEQNCDVLRAGAKIDESVHRYYNALGEHTVQIEHQMDSIRNDDLRLKHRLSTGELPGPIQQLTNLIDFLKDTT